MVSLLGHTLFNWALKYLKTAFISMIVLTEPLYATFLGIIIFSELPSITTAVGGFVVLAGYWMKKGERSLAMSKLWSRAGGKAMFSL